MPTPTSITVPLTNETVGECYEWLFAPWVKELGLRDFSVAPGQAIAILPQNQRLQFVSGAICGQVIMSAVKFKKHARAPNTFLSRATRSASQAIA